MSKKKKDQHKDEKKSKRQAQQAADTGQPEEPIAETNSGERLDNDKPNKKAVVAEQGKPIELPGPKPSQDKQKQAEKKAKPDDDSFVILSDDKEEDKKQRKVIKKSVYKQELKKLQIELVKLQEWVKFKGLKVVVIFEGRDAAGKGGVIKRITEALNPRNCHVEALPVPTEKEKTQWYFQRYVDRLPSAGEMVLFDRSWYNRAGVERVMGFCTEAELREFLRSCPEFERMLIRSGIILIKYWFSVSDDEQEKRFQARLSDPTKRWKLSKIDLESRNRWVDYSRAKDEMFAYTDTRQSHWYVVNADIKRHARLNCISHLLSMIPYEDLTPLPIKLPPRQNDTEYVRSPMSDQTFVPERYGADSK